VRGDQGARQPNQPAEPGPVRQYSAIAILSVAAVEIGPEVGRRKSHNQLQSLEKSSVVNRENRELKPKSFAFRKIPE
jgi:hypothetical protein